jgi:hypothetical protein
MSNSSLDKVDSFQDFHFKITMIFIGFPASS